MLTRRYSYQYADIRCGYNKLTLMLGTLTIDIWTSEKKIVFELKS